MNGNPVNKANSPSLVSLPTSRNGSFSYHQPLHPNQHPIVHRCRFTDYIPGTITAIAASPPTWKSHSQLNPAYPSNAQDSLQPSASNSLRAVLAVGRANGDIQIWTWINDGPTATHQASHPTYQNRKNPISSSQAWSLYRTLPGHTPSNLEQNSSSHLPHHSSAKIEHLVFAHQIIPSDFDHSNPDHEQIQSMSRKIPRLLGSHGADEVIEWVWEGPLAGTIKRTLSMPPMVAIWSLSVSPGSTRLAVGCDDGRIRIANISDDELELIRVLDPCKTRILSLSWGILEPPPSSINHNDNNSQYPIEPPDSRLFIVAGCADSSLRKWTVSSGRCVNRMTVEKLQGEQTLVWSVTIVNGTIVSGDSLGNVHFWDLKTFTRRQTIRAHRADVLCITASADGQTIFTSGVDQKTCQLSLNVQQVQNTGKISQSRWLLSASRRLHSHDVRALEVSPPYNPLFSDSSVFSDTTSFSSNLVQKIRSMVPVLISGGLDMSLVFCPAAPPVSTLAANNKIDYNLLRNPISDSYSVSFADSMERKISYVINRDPVAQIAHHANLLVCRNSKRISIWHLKPHDSEELNLTIQKKPPVAQAEDNQPAWAKVLEMDLKCRTNLISSAISSDGKWVAVSDLYEVKLFNLNKLEDGTLQPRRMKGFQGFASLKSSKSRNQGARSIEFSTDSVRLVLVGSLTSDLAVIGLDYSQKTPNVNILRVFYQHSSLVHQLDHLHRPVITPSRNPNNNLPSDNSPSDDQTPNLNPLPNSHIDRDVYVIKMAISPDGQWLATADSTRTLHIYNMDALKHHCYLPIPSHLVNSLAFPPSMPSVLVIGFANNTLQVIDVESRKVPEWARELNGNRPEGLVDIRDSMIGMVFQPLRTHTDQNNTSRSNSCLPNDDRSMTIDENGSNHQSKAQSATAKLNQNNKVVVGLIWGANWVCKMTIPDPNQLVSQLHQGKNIQPLMKRFKKRRFDTLDLPPSKLSTTIEENHNLKVSNDKQKKSNGKSNGHVDGRKSKLNQVKKDGLKTNGNEIEEEQEDTKMKIDQEEEDHERIIKKILVEEEGLGGGRLLTPNFQISHKYQSILAIDYFNYHQLVVVERPFFSFISDNLLPPAWHRVGAYGT